MATKQVFKVREIKIPSDLAERIDAAANKPSGSLRDALANEGRLHQLDRTLLAIAMARELRKMVKVEDLPTSKPMTLERFAEISFAMLLAYMVGTYQFNKDGELEIGTARDIVYMEHLREADRVELASGLQLPPSVLFTLLGSMTNANHLKQIWQDMVGKAPFKRTTIRIQDAMRYAETLLDCVDKLTEVLAKK